MTNNVDPQSPHRPLAIVLGVATVLFVGLFVGAFALGGVTGNVWGEIITQAGKSGSSKVQHLPAGSVVIWQDTVIARLETVHMVGLGNSSSKIAIYSGRWVNRDPNSWRDVSGFSAEVMPDSVGRAVVIQLVREPRNLWRVGELRLEPFVRAIPIYQNELGKL